MIKTRIKIGEGVVRDFYEAYGFVFLEGDKRLCAPEKEGTVTSYVEQEGENPDPRTVDAPFDYTAKFLVEATGKGIDTINGKIAKFNADTREIVSGTDVKQKKQIAFYNPHDHLCIVGYANTIAEAEDLYISPRYGKLDCAVIELKIRVSKPSLCNFNLESEKDN